MSWMRKGVLTVSVLSLTPAAFAAPSLLPLKHVRLYETGVAYFERTGTLGTNAVTLPVPASHLDDALKTLVVYSTNGAAHVGGVEFGSSVTPGMGRALAGVPTGEGPLSLGALLQSLKGARVAITLERGTLDGRLVEVLDSETSDLETCTRSTDSSAAAKGEADSESNSAECTPTKVPSLVVMTPRSELRRVPLSAVRGVRPTDPAIASRLNAALDALSGGSARILKELRVLARGQSLSLGYVSEAPVWRASYRLVLDSVDSGHDKQNSALQGWALVHNDTDEPWRGVRLELVNGRPDSFLFPLAAPRYARRELVTPENPLSTVPQLMRTTPDAMWNVDDDDGTTSYYGALSGAGEGGGGYGEGIGLGNIGVIGHGAGSARNDDSALLSVGNLAGTASSEGVESGSLFRYALADKLDLRAHGSALVPFVGEGIEARRIAFFGTPDSAARSAVYITHHGQQTLPAGTVAVFSDSGFAGESALPRLKPGETTTVEYGSDLDVNLSEISAPPRDEPRALRFEEWNLVEHYVRHRRMTEHLENRSGEKRDVFVGVDAINNAAIHGADETVYDSRRTKAFAVFALAGRSSADRTVDIDEGLSRKHSVRTLRASALRAFAATASLPEAERAVVRQAATELALAEAKRVVLRQTNAELEIRESEVTRFRGDASALGAAHGTEDVIKRMLEAEDRAEMLRKRARRLQQESDQLGRIATRTLSRLPR